jgi:hypothetical protein
MKKLLVTLAAVLVSVSTFAQGTIKFNNRLTGQVDAPVTLPGGTTGFGSIAGAQAQLFLVTGSGATATYTALTPATTFRSSSPAAMPYVNEPTVGVVVPGVAAGSQATIVLRAWAGGATYDPASNSHYGQSAPITIGLGGTPAVGAPIPDAVLTGLQGFSVTVVPEPSTIALGLLGAAALLYRRRK